MAASAGAAERTLRRWVSAVIGSPRFSRALPPSATTTRTTTASRTERGDHDRLDGVQAVLRLVEHDGVLGLEDVVGDLEALEPVLLEDLLPHLRLAVVERRQAVHELHLRVPGPGDRLAVDLVRLEELDPFAPHALVLAHRHPHVGVEEVDSLHSLVHVGGEGEAGARLLLDGAGGVAPGGPRAQPPAGAQPGPPTPPSPP